MEIIGNKHPSIARCFCFRQDAAQPPDENAPVLVVFKYPPPFYPTTIDVVQSASGGSILDCLGMSFLYHTRKEKETQFCMGVPIANGDDLRSP